MGLLLCRLLGASGSHSKGNPFGPLAGASTFWLIFSLPLAYRVGQSQATWFFSAMQLVIGGCYLVFATLYGMRPYWALCVALASGGVVLALLRASPLLAVSTGAALEFAFAARLSGGVESAYHPAEPASRSFGARHRRTPNTRQPPAQP